MPLQYVKFNFILEIGSKISYSTIGDKSPSSFLSILNNNNDCNLVIFVK